MCLHHTGSGPLGVAYGDAEPQSGVGPLSSLDILLAFSSPGSKNQRLVVEGLADSGVL